jgi:hypothetical protein
MNTKYEKPYVRSLGENLPTAQGECALGSVAAGLNGYCGTGDGVLSGCTKGSTASDTGCGIGNGPSTGACNTGLLPTEYGCGNGNSARNTSGGCHGGGGAF